MPRGREIWRYKCIPNSYIKKWLLYLPTRSRRRTTSIWWVIWSSSLLIIWWWQQGIKVGRIYTSIEKRGFKGRKREVDHVEDSYNDRKSQFQRYNTSSPSSQITNVNFNSLIPTRKLEPQNSQVKNQTESFPKKTYQRV
jgi:hypothetical protein